MVSFHILYSRSQFTYERTYREIYHVIAYYAYQCTCHTVAQNYRIPGNTQTETNYGIAHHFINSVLYTHNVVHSGR